MAEYDGVHIAVSYWWESHCEDNPEPGDCEACGVDQLSLDYLADAAWSALGTALWSASDEDGTPLEACGFSMEDIDDDMADSFAREVAEFCHMQTRDVTGLGAGQVGHDFALTRNGHGAGFWDRGLGELGDRLTEACRPYGECHLYVGDDGKVYADG